VLCAFVKRQEIHFQKPYNMKGMIFGLFVLIACTYAADDKKEVVDEDGTKIYKRLIPADVLRGRC
jgi:hypothetical protein